MSGRAALGHAIEHTAKKQIAKSLPVVRGTVESVTPLTIKLFGFSHPLTEDDFDLSQWVKLYRHIVGIHEGDLVLVHETDTWVVFDVVSDHNVVGQFTSNWWSDP